MKVSQLMSTRPYMQEARERFNKISEGHFVWCRVFLQCSEMKVTNLRSSNLSSDIQKYRPSSSYHAVPACRRNKMLERTLATLNASSPTMSHALEQTKGARIGVICKSASSKLSASCLHGYTVSMQKIQGFLFWKAIFAIPPIVPAVTIHTLPWKMRVERCPLSFQYGILPASFPFWAWCGDFQFRGCISTKTLSSKRGLLTGTSWNWHICPLHAWK